MGILNIGVQALQANQVALTTAGNNIANASTAGYSRQRVILQTVPGQFTGGGYIGKGVTVQTIQRNFDAFLTRQATISAATASADTMRASKLKQLEGIFGSGTSGLGASISDMLNAFSDVASAPTDLTARTVALTRVDETAARMRAASQSMDDLQSGLSQELQQKVDAVNSLAKSIAAVNQQIAGVNGNGQPPNDLLDRRDQLIRELNQYIQTSSVPADDGSVGIFVGGSQALVLGSTAATLNLANKDEFGDVLKSKLSITRSGVVIPLDENNLGGGEISGLLRFQNVDLVEGRNLLGRLTMGITTAMNDQHRLGLDLDGNPGGNLFTQASFGSQNVLQPVAPATVNAGTSSLSLGIADVTKFVASDYELNFSSGTAGTITRRSDGVVTAFDFGTTNPVVIDGIAITEGTLGGAAAGDRFLLKPFSTSATTIASQFSTPRALAVASPVVGLMGTTNTGNLQQVSIVARQNPPTNVPVTLTFTGPNSYTRSDVAGAFTYTPGQPIEGTVPATTPLSEWSVTLQGTPQAGDTFVVRDIQDPTINVDYRLNAGNAKALMDLRDLALFDGAPLTDGYASLISQIGVRTQSANYAADVSSSIAANTEKDRAGISGVNLDEEAAKLLQYQQAYQASAKMIQIAQSIFDTLIQGLGR